MSLLRREPLKVDVDLKLDVLADGVDPVGWLVLAQKILLATFEKPGIIKGSPIKRSFLLAIILANRYSWYFLPQSDLQTPIKGPVHLCEQTHSNTKSLII